jgi:ketosteroid isomerase-like protein
MTEVATEISDLADEFFGAVTAGDMATVRRLYAPDATIWHNFDNTDQTPEQNLTLLSWVSANWVDFRFSDVRRHSIDGGFLQQHVMNGKDPETGQAFAAPAILMVLVDGGRITRIEEYFDPGQVPLPA